MNFESEIKRIYPERAYVGSDRKIEKLKKLESGEFPKLELNEKERKNLLEFENKLGEDLEKIYLIPETSFTFYPEYFLTKEGRDDFVKTTGVNIEGENDAEIERSIYKNRDSIRKISAQEISALTGRSRTSADNRLHKALYENMNKETGELNIDKVKAPKRTHFILDPQKALEKITGLRNFKDNLKGLLEEARKSTEGESNFSKAKTNILELYKRKVNQMIAEQFYAGVSTFQMSKVLGESNLTKDESELIKKFVGLRSKEVNYSRYDKFIHGASTEYTEHNEKKVAEQISEELKRYADKTERELIFSALDRDKDIRKKGLDPKKIFEKDVPVEQFKEWTEEVLDAYGELSSQPPEEYDPSRNGAPPDGKWQFIARSEYKSMAVDGKQHIVKSPDSKKSIYDTVAVLLGHETEGHFIQHLNKSKVGLKLFEKMGGDRSEIFFEGGAEMIQEEVTRKAFGFESVQWPYYVKAMSRRLDGGNYLDCVKAFFGSAFKATKAKKEAGSIDEDQFSSEIKGTLNLAIDRSKRLFREGTEFDSKSNVLVKSKDTVYLEQELLLKKLKEAGYEQYAFVGGVNLDTLRILAETGLLNLKEITKPKFYSLEIWERIKDKYKF